MRAQIGNPGVEIDHPLGLTSGEFVAVASGLLKGKQIAAQGVYRRLFSGECDQPDLHAPPPRIAAIEREDSDEGEVVKFTLRVPGAGREGERGHAGALGELETESVLIPMIGRTRQRTYTLCLSSQIGCAMGCEFCETAQMGLIRNLSAGEIVAQWWAATHQVGVRPSNVVFMGMGEPMDNLDAVLGSIAVLTDHRGPALPMSKISISTVGRVDGIRRLGERVIAHGWRKLGLAVSLNASNDKVRSSIMPLNRATPMAELKEALLQYPLLGNKLCIEYVLIPGVNDAPEHACELAAYLAPWLERPCRAVVNVIAYNPRRNSPWEAPRDACVERFIGKLNEAGVFCRRRRTKGRSLMGACGQLGNEQIRGRRLVQMPLTVGGQ